MKACLFAIDAFFEETGTRLPVMISGTIFDDGRTLSAQPIEAFYYSVSHIDALSVGLNCAVGVDLMRGPIERLVLDLPHAGSVAIRTRACPTASAGFLGDRDHTAAVLGEFARNGWLNIVGGCCGTTPEWIAAIGQGDRRRDARADSRRCRTGRPTAAWSRWSIRPETNFVMIGERTNITGSKRFARLIKSGDFEAALAVARDQVEGGANILDVNMDEGMIDGEQAMTRFLNLVSADPAIAKIPIMVDSSKWTVIEAGLKCVQGKSIVNSISLKEGEEEFLRQARLVRRYGAAVVVMAFDEEGQAVTARPQGRHLPPRLQAADREGRLSARGHHLRRQHPHRRHRHRGAQQLRRRVHRGGARAQAAFSRVQDVRRREQRLVLVPRQRRRPRGDERRVPVPRDPRRAGHGDRQRRPARGLRRDPQGPARAGRGRAPQPPARRRRPAHRVCRVGQVDEEEGPRQGPRLARRAGRGAAQARADHRHVDYIDADVEEARQTYDRSLSIIEGPLWTA